MSLTETAYVPAKEEQDEDEGGGDSEEKAEFAESKVSVQHTAGGDKSVEERRLAIKERKILLKERRLDEQRIQLQQQRELQEKRLEDQRLQREQQLEQQKLQLEEQRLQREQQWEEQRRQREFDKRKWREERAYKDSTAVKIRTWGDTLRNTITKMLVRALMSYRGLSVLTNCSSSYQSQLIYFDSALFFGPRKAFNE